MVTAVSSTVSCLAAVYGEPQVDMMLPIPSTGNRRESVKKLTAGQLVEPGHHERPQR
jgi:hypothetical protein